MTESSRWTVIDSAVVLDTRWLRVERNSYSTNNGKVIDDYYIVERKPFVLVIATRKSEVLLIRQYRAATDRYYWCLPAGYIEPGESPELAGSRELVEETGFELGEPTTIARLDPLPGYIRSAAFVVMGEISAEQNDPSDDEAAGSRWCSRDEISAQLVAGSIDEMQAVAALGVWLARGAALSR